MVKTDWSKISKYGDSIVLRIPARLFSDEAFPFKEGETVSVSIGRETLVIKKE